jgi:hypothetical protein
VRIRRGDIASWSNVESSKDSDLFEDHPLHYIRYIRSAEKVFIDVTSPEDRLL